MIWPGPKLLRPIAGESGLVIFSALLARRWPAAGARRSRHGSDARAAERGIPPEPDFDRAAMAAARQDHRQLLDDLHRARAPAPPLSIQSFPRGRHRADAPASDRLGRR